MTHAIASTQIGQTVKILREQRGLKQSELATQIGFGQAMISRIEKGDRNPSYPMLRKIADFFGVTVDSLLDGEHPLPTDAAETAVEVAR